MLTIDDDQMQRLEKARLHELDPKIDAWLLDQHPHWQTIELGQRRQILSQMIDWGQAAGMTAETDYALYCDLMVRIGPAWQQFAAHEDAREIVEDRDSSPPMKLEELTELAAQRAEEEARR